MLVSGNNNVIATSSGNDKALLLVKVEQTFNLTKTVKHAYQKDKLYSKILEKSKAHALFGCKDSLIFTKNLLKQDVLCVPHEAFHNGRWVIEIIIDHTPNNWSFWPIPDCTIHQKILLVDIYGTRHESVLHIMWCMCCS